MHRWLLCLLGILAIPSVVCAQTIVQNTDLRMITRTDGVIPVGDGTKFVGESGATARTSLGLGSIATQAASAVAITGGTINGTAIGGATAAAGAFTTIGATGNLSLANTTSDSTGVVTKGGTAFLHNFQHPTGDTAIPIGKNTFVGLGSGNLTLGSTATSTTHGSQNTGVGYGSLTSLTTGYQNNAIGESALYNANTGFCNNAMGLGALAALTSGSYNSGVGRYALAGCTTGTYLVGFGNQAGTYIADGTTPNTTSDYCTYLGAGVCASADDAQNETAIGYGAIGDGSNTIRLGNTSITNVRTAGKLDATGLTLRELSADPSDPTEGSSCLWQSNGTGAGDDGDIMVKITAGGVTKTITLIDFSAF